MGVIGESRHGREKQDRGKQYFEPKACHQIFLCIAGLNVRPCARERRGQKEALVGYVSNNHSDHRDHHRDSGDVVAMHECQQRSCETEADAHPFDECGHVRFPFAGISSGGLAEGTATPPAFEAGQRFDLGSSSARRLQSASHSFAFCPVWSWFREGGSPFASFVVRPLGHRPFGLPLFGSRVPSPVYSGCPLGHHSVFLIIKIASHCTHCDKEIITNKVSLITSL